MRHLLLTALLVALALAGCSSPADTTADDGFDADVDAPEAAEAELDIDESPDAPEEPAEEGAGGLSDTDAAAPALPAAASSGDRIIKEGTVTVAVEPGGFDAAYAAVVDVAARYGGSVVASTTRTEDTGTAGSLTVRVPVEDYERLLVGVGDIGEIVERRITAEDVTEEFTDLESRLRHLGAQETFYLELLEEADGVSDAIAVREQLDDLQAEVERVRGRLQLLEARTTFSTLTVELFEPGAPEAVITAGPTTPGTNLAEYWERAQDAFVNVVGSLLVATFFLAPLLAPAALAYVVWRGFRGRPATVAVEPKS